MTLLCQLASDFRRMASNVMPIGLEVIHYFMTYLVLLSLHHSVYSAITAHIQEYNTERIFTTQLHFGGCGMEVM